MTVTIDFDAPTDQVKSPAILAHVVLRTAKFKEMVDFYKTFLGASAAYENDFLSFLTYDEEHHRIALLAVPGTGPKVPTSSGLEHIAFAYEKLEDLALAYRQRKAKGILPAWSVNHGPTTSIYYKDPDGNMIETQVDNFDVPDDATKFMMSKEFEENPFGTDFEPEDLIRRLRAGEDEKSIKKRIESGPRGIPDL
ncbi:Glyoxalase/Bleomycin resistance protein/Dihydroxybiphenyl dioxygenase [Mytilinidion resinicola]|uniref:Glyoxalase/Bleomycin resistance protein/Dihydroxybiphenyl dioxygenase n=1 Tax=Mytilinidion resinicola TaxID=574789 RepID=A0A6A6YTB5_9PEZI|nr:Glyoxalase/Bleomycin resistance protein/Dihydroxybiphenyl dioxygenase [Mytilinidion resinicola]KAF2812011.1 Glyoxalase/Bleomycin resistance protein/Dihydroxybiphenyl dioxygenase [Mytilinidion resinicola]